GSGGSIPGDRDARCSRERMLTVHLKFGHPSADVALDELGRGAAVENGPVVHDDQVVAAPGSSINFEIPIQLLTEWSAASVYSFAMTVSISGSETYTSFNSPRWIRREITSPAVHFVRSKATERVVPSRLTTSHGPVSSPAGGETYSAVTTVGAPALLRSPSMLPS